MPRFSKTRKGFSHNHFKLNILVCLSKHRPNHLCPHLECGAHYEVTGTQATKYYFAGAQRIALRTPDGALKYMLGDHLGSTSLVADSNGALVTETKYKACPLRYRYGVLREGEVRYTTPNTTLPTRYTFTGQYSYVSDTATDLGSNGFGLMFYNARWYDSTTGRFAQADSIVPGGVQGLDRYAYVSNNPMNFVDPSGHIDCTWNEKEQLEECRQGDQGMHVSVPKEENEGISPPFMFTRLPVDHVTRTLWYGPTYAAYGNHESGDPFKYDNYSQGWHGGIDFFTEAGSDVYMSVNQEGVVVEVRATSHGYALYVQYGNIVIVYQHIETTLKEGDIVKVGDVVGQVVSWILPDGSDNSHVHIEVREVSQSLDSKGKYIKGLGPAYLLNPLKYMAVATVADLMQFKDANEFALDWSDDPLYYVDMVLLIGGCVIWNSNNCMPGN
jgi:RHS repeat-associated protein